jgi:hypothetical protein
LDFGHDSIYWGVRVGVDGDVDRVAHAYGADLGFVDPSLAAWAAQKSRAG